MIQHANYETENLFSELCARVRKMKLYKSTHTHCGVLCSLIPLINYSPVFCPPQTKPSEGFGSSPGFALSAVLS